MSFLKKKTTRPEPNSSDKTKVTPKKRAWRIFLIIFSVLILVVVSYTAMLIATGSKVLQNGLTASSILKTLTGSKTKLKGQDNNRINVLLLGMGGPDHPGGLLTDSIMVASIRPSDKKVALLSVPRDLLVDISGHGQDKINTAFADGYNDYYSKNCNKKSETSCKQDAMTAGANLSIATVSNVLNIPIDYYVTANFTGFESIINTLGGVDVYVDKTLIDPYFPADDMVHYAPLKITAGEHHMDGKTALQYARSRETTSDFDRAARQQKILSAVKDKALSTGFLSNPVKIANVISTLGDSVKVSFSLDELKTFASLISGVSDQNITNQVITNGPTGLLNDYNNGIYYLVPKTGNFKQIQELANNIFDYKQKEEATIEIQNASNTSGIGTILGTDLQDEGYTISSVVTNKTKVPTTVIYDLTSGNKPVTASFLKSKLSASVVQVARKSTDTADFRIVLGTDYKSSSN